MMTLITMDISVAHLTSLKNEATGTPLADIYRRYRPPMIAAGFVAICLIGLLHHICAMSNAEMMKFYDEFQRNSLSTNSRDKTAAVMSGEDKASTDHTRGYCCPESGRNSSEMDLREEGLDVYDRKKLIACTILTGTAVIAFCLLTSLIGGFSSMAHNEPNRPKFVSHI